MLYGLADSNNFFCSCERVFRPDLIGRPVVVLSNNDGCIIARSNESKALGLKMGDPYFKVRPLLERHGVAVFSSNYALYADMSRRVMSILARSVPHIDIYSIDEAFLDLTGIPQVKEFTERLVAYINKGTGIPISIGIAPTKTLAKIASKFAKKYPGYHGVCVIDTEEKRTQALRLFPIEDVWGIGRRSTKRLKSKGIETAYDFTCQPSSWVLQQFTVTGLRTWRELRGHDCISVEELPYKKTICSSRSFPAQGLSSLADVEEAIASHAATCHRRLRSQRCVCGNITIFAHTSMYRPEIPPHFIQRDYRFPVATASLSEIVDAAVGMLRASWAYHRPVPYLYKRAGAIVWDISRANAVQGSLFDTVDRERQRRLDHTLADLDRALGPGTVKMAVQAGNPARWLPQAQSLSPRYTTDLDHLLRLRTR